MKLQKKIEEIKFTDCDVWGTVMPVSENIVMMSAAGTWYVGAICKEDCGGMVVPFDRYTDYYATPERWMNNFRVMVDVLHDIEVLENLVIAMTEGASDEKRMALNSVEKLIAEKKAIVTAFEKEFADDNTQQAD